MTTVHTLTAALADRYRIERELGTGGMATVYLAHDLRHERDVAIKVLHQELAAALGAERFLGEIKTTAKLQHPHILPLLDSGDAAGLLYYVMPYVAGESLRDRLTREKQLPIDDAVQIAREVADALGHAHGHGVIHRDIKPENILLQEGHALVADFGIALAVQSAGGARMTQTGLSLGTPQYMSPEQAMGEKAIDARADIYALGAVTYEMLTGEPPFTGATVQAIVARVLSEEPRPITRVRRTVPAQVEAAVLTALAKLPADRWTSPAQFAEALINLRIPSANGHVERREAAWVWPAVSGMVVLIALVAVGWIVQGTVGTPNGSSSALRFPLTIGNPPRTRNVWGAAVRISRDGRRLLYQTGNGQSVLDLRTGTSAPIWDDRSANDAALSPSADSAVVRTSGWMGQLWITDISTRRASLVTTKAAAFMHWADDGWIYFRDNLESVGLSRLRVSDLKRENILTMAEADSTYPENPFPIPGSRGLLYARRRQISAPASQAEIAVFDLRSRRSRVLLNGMAAVVTKSGYLLAAQADGGLLAARFNPRTLQLLGTPVRVLEDVETSAVGMYLRASFDISDEGTLVYVRRTPVVEDSLALVGRDGRPTSPPEAWGGWIGNVVQSRDGSYFAMELSVGIDRPNIWVKGGGDAQPRRLTFGDVLDYYPQFVDGGRRVAFVSPRQGGNWDLYVVPLDGSASPTKLVDRPGDILSPQFDESQEWVVFCERDGRDGRDVFAHRFGVHAATFPIAATSANECFPALSPDGRWVAYESDETGRFEVFVRPLQGGNAARWQISAGGGRQPAWSLDGRELTFTNAGAEVVSVPTRLGPSFSFGAARRLFAIDTQTFWLRAPLTGNSGFALARRRAEAPGQVIVIRNFDAVIREKLGR